MLGPTRTLFVGFWEAELGSIPWRKLLGQLADPNVEEHGTGLTPVRAALMPVAKASSAHDEAPGDGVFEDIVALRDNLRQTAGLGNTFDWPDSFLFVYVYCSNDGIGCFRIFIGYCDRPA